MTRRPWLACALALAACAHYPENPPLAHYDRGAGYRFRSPDAPPDPRDETLVVVTFSGGGTRAAAFAYGALEALRDADIGGGRKLLGEVDVISSVSGGSFAAAYYGLFGEERFFERFPDDVLYRPMARHLILKVIAPWNWPRLMSLWYSRADLASEYYDEEIFEGRRYDSMPRERPFIVLNATDITRGVQFSFTQEHFDRLCSDLDGVAVARGVTASSAFPVAFPPLTLRNRSKESCGYTAPGWVETGELDFDLNPPRWALARSWREYESAENRPYLHLSDGGISDNLGLRVVRASIDGGGSYGIYENAATVRRLVVIAVDAKPRGEPELDRSARAPGFFHVLESAASRPMENYSADTVELVRDWFEEWERGKEDRNHARDYCDARPAPEIAACRAHFALDETPEAEAEPELFLIHVRFDAIPDADARKELESISTDLQLPSEQVDALKMWSRRLLLDSPRFQQLVETLRAGNGG